MMTRSAIVAVTLGLLGPVRGQQTEPPPWAEVRTILEQRCLECHGRDRVKSEFRLATAETFRRGGARGPVVDAQNPERSRLLEVISYRDPDLAMPPTRQLPEAERATLRAWVLGGAPWPEDEPGRLADPHAFTEDHGAKDQNPRDWWAYRPLSADDPADRSEPHAIDRFLGRERDRRGLGVTAQADPVVLLRRATYDLTGLPPSREESDAFHAAIARDGFDAAWATLVDRLLESPRYGEHWARHWLDLVRFAETNGYERDGTKKNIWRYRDWVIRALNEDMPYDRFALEQLAGDEIAEHAPELLDHGVLGSGPLIATGYYRLPVWDDEPADRKQALADELADVVDTTAQVFLASSVGCARCHDHKADPISQKDYFAFTALFNNVVSYGGDGFGQARGGGMVRNLADEPRHDQIPVAERNRRVAAIDKQLEPFLAALRGAVDASKDPDSITLVADARDENSPNWKYKQGGAPNRWPSPGFDDSKWKSARGGFGTKGTPGAIVNQLWRGRRINLRTRFALTKIPKSLVLTFYHDEDIEVFLNGTPVFSRKHYRVDYTEVQLPQAAVDALVVGSNVVAVSCRQTGGGQYVDVGLRTGWLDDEIAARVRLGVEGERWIGDERAAEARALLAKRDHTRNLPVPNAYPALTARERGRTAKPQHVMLRGSAHALGDVVDASVPVVLCSTDGAPEPSVPEPAADATSTGRRLAFARWLAADGAAVSSRVMANRLWQFHFGRGLCRTPGDFGRFGEKPTHPELLDHLAQAFIDRAWSLKAMHRYLMTSAAYRMASTGRDDGLAKDPRNDAYWRFDPRRLSAEEFRDSVLAVSGELNNKLYGPSVYPPLPQEVRATASRPGAAWGNSAPQDAARRSVYVFVKRSLRMPLFEALDQPDPDLPCSERFETNVPTQALMTMNGEFVRDQAASFAASLAEATDSRRDRIRLGVERALGRTCSEGDIARHDAFMARLRTEHSMDERAALSLFCLALFNLNEFLWLD